MVYGTGMRPVFWVGFPQFAVVSHFVSFFSRLLMCVGGRLPPGLACGKCLPPRGQATNSFVWAGGVIRARQMGEGIGEGALEPKACPDSDNRLDTGQRLCRDNLFRSLWETERQMISALCGIVLADLCSIPPAAPSPRDVPCRRFGTGYGHRTLFEGGGGGIRKVGSNNPPKEFSPCPGFAPSPQHSKRLGAEQ